VLVQIALAGGRLKMAEIADTVVVTRGGVTKLVDRLVAKRYLERVPSPDDRRVIYAELSEAGRDALREVQPVLERVMEARIGSALSGDQLNALHLAAHELCLNNEGWGMPEAVPDEIEAAPAT
jgi:DNA-binding MarR family transcriptional regulator